MTTFFTLTPAYAGGHNTHSPTLNELLEIARGITLDRLRDKCLEYGLTEDMGGCEYGCTLQGFLEKYETIPSDDLTCVMIGDGITQYSTSETGHREHTEMIRRAFALLVLDECFKRGFAVSLTIT